MLQGSLENFALDEVLGLLSGTSKTGQLEIAGNRGTGSLVFDDGRLVDGTASYTANGCDLEDVMFELLRYDDGTFTFTSREVTSVDNPENVASVLASAENRLRDWRSIEVVVPTLNHHVAPSPDLPADEITITRSEWAALTVIAAGCPVSLVCDKLDLGEVEGSRCIKNLAERALVTVSEPLGGFASVHRSSQASAEPAAPAPAPYVAPADESLTTPAEHLAAALGEDSPAEVAEVAESAPTGSAALDALTAERPPMPPIPVPEDLEEEASAPPAPPSPAEISEFGEGLTDASELVESADDTRGGGLLARYLKSDD